MRFSIRKNSRPHSKERRVFLWGGLFCISLGFNLAARTVPGFAEWYAVRVYPVFVNTLGRFSSLFPFSVIEVLFYLAALTVLAGMIAICRKKLRLQKAAAVLVKVLLVLFAVFTLNCGINYHRMPFSERAGFAIQKSTEDELVALCEFLVEEINQAADGLSVDSDGHCKLEGDISREAKNAMQQAEEEYPELSGYYPDAKPVLSTWYFSWQLLQGAYSPFTIEANYNNGMPDQDKPSTICHELSHLKGFMREDEANFISYLACRASESREFRYSGSLLAYIYAGNALYKQNAETFREVRAGLCDQAVRDLKDHNAYWERYRGTVSEVSDKLNDTYLKANAQEDGVKSYGRMVDLLLAWNRERLKEEMSAESNAQKDE